METRAAHSGLIVMYSTRMIPRLAQLSLYWSRSAKIYSHTYPQASKGSPLLLLADFEENYCEVYLESL